jgi:hypothetical protein
LERYRRAELQLREIIALDESLLRQKDQTIQETMSGTIINLIIQLIAGVIGGNGAGSALKDYSLGGLATRLWVQLVPSWRAGASGIYTRAGRGDRRWARCGGYRGQLVGGGASAAILTIIVGLVKNMTASK